MSINVLLYSTQGCHLCELAMELIANLGTEYQPEIIDIAQDDILFERYGVRIPVIQRKDNQQELGWPFDENQLIEFLS